MLSQEGSYRRQKRLLREMQQRGYDLFLTGDFRTVYYLTGVLTSPEAPTVFVLRQDETSVLITSSSNEGCASEILRLETYSINRSITNPTHDAAALLQDVLRKKQVSTCGVDRAGTPGLYEELAPNCADATSIILKLRKYKECDEIAEIRQSLCYCGVAYNAARTAIAPGVSEIDVYNAMYRDVVQEAGGPILFNGDFACGERCIKEGGAPTRRRIEEGDLYILDLFPAPALYFGDTCRTFAASTPTDLQYRAWSIVNEAVRMAESSIKPGVRAREVYALVKEFLDSHEITEKSFWHHAGHGIGHRGHEAPRIIPGTDDIFEVGDVITLEPGVYTKSLQGGIRLEDNYVVGENGLENLFSHPKEL